MAAKRIYFCFGRLVPVCLLATMLGAAEHRGIVKSGGIPIPGATVTAIQGDRKVATTTDEHGAYVFPNLDDGIWTVQVEMLGFATASQEIGVAMNAPTPEWNLKLQSAEELRAALTPPAPPKAAASTIPAAASSAAPAQTASAPAAAPPSAGGNARPSILGGVQGQGRGTQRASGRGQRGQDAAQDGFQRLDVNQAGDLAAAGSEGLLSNQAAADLSSNASEAFLVNGSVSTGLGMPQGPPDWFGGRGGMEGFGPMGMGPGMTGEGTPGMGNNGEPVTPGETGQAGPAARGGPGGGPGGFGGRGGFGGPGGRGGFGGGPGMMGGRGGRSGRGGAGARPGQFAFGNARRDRRMQYNGNLGFTLDNSVWDAQTYSVTGNQVQKPAYANARMNATCSAGRCAFLTCSAAAAACSCSTSR